MGGSGCFMDQGRVPASYFKDLQFFPDSNTPDSVSSETQSDESQKKLISINEYPVKDVLPMLLKDKTTKENIIFATDSYSEYGEGYTEKDHITVEKLLGFNEFEIQPRVLKSLEAQKLRTKVKAEVMTPSWIVCKMNAHCDEEWFGYPDVFETLENQTWTPRTGKIEFPDGKSWKSYVDSRRIEITCGEAPYIVSRYDTTTGETIPISHRTGLLDRKLRIVNENTDNEEEWLKWTERAYQSVYGYEWQGDSLLIARINLLITYVDYMVDRWNRKPATAELRNISNIIAWNIWQMDAFTGTIPYGTPEKEDECEFLGMDAFGDAFAVEKPENETPICLVRDWRECKGGAVHKYTDFKE